MNLHNTLNIVFISLILINFNANAEQSAEAAACNQAVNKSDFASAISKADALLKKSADNRDGLLCKGRALGAQGKYSEALSALEAADKQSKDGFDSIISNMLIGNLHKSNQKYAEAVASYEKSMGFAKTTSNEKFERINHNLIASVAVLKNDQNAALASYQAGSKLAMNDNERAESFELLAATYKALAQYDAAIEYQIKAVQMQKIAGTLDEYADASLALGQIQIAAKDYVSADKTLSKFARFAKDNGGAYYEAKANLYLAQSKAASGDAASAKTLLADARNTAKSINANDLTSQIESAEKKLNN